MNITRDVVIAYPFENAVAGSVTTFPIDADEFYGAPGQQHYRLLSYLASQMNGQTILDIGTHKGSSALALSVNPTNTIYSFDIQRKVPLRDLPNVSFELANLWDPTVRNYWKSTILGSALIVLDIDPHDGDMEYEFYSWLKTEGFKGILLCDDIWYFKGMRDNFWFKIPTADKVDITALGHWSGTGIIAFAPEAQAHVWETFAGQRAIAAAAAPEATPWTIVTAYFDLTRMPDASVSIKARDRNHYLDSALATLALDQPMVVYCEEDSLADLKARRPANLHEKTQFIVIDFESLPLTKYRQKIIENRVTHPYQGDDRNTASYYLLCMARYALLKRTMDENPFGSTHFAWLNICIERMGYKNVAHLEDVFLGPPRDKVSTCYIDYIPKSALEPVESYYQFGRCSLCSGFFTGRKDYFYEFCNKIEEKFMYYLEKGYGHADEQLFSPVYFENRDIFDLYYGDYFQMITNYRYIYDNPNITLRLVIPKSFAAGDWTTCMNACKFVMASVEKGAIVLSDGEREALGNMYKSAFNAAAD